MLPPLLTKVPTNPFLLDSAEDIGGSAATVGVSVIGQWGLRYVLHLLPQRPPILNWAIDGTGTSVFLRYLLCLRLLAKLPTIFVDDKDEYALICDSGAYAIGNTSKRFSRSLSELLPTSTWCLVDSNDAVPTVPDYLLSLGKFVVQAEKMNTKSVEWLDNIDVNSSTRYYMKRWTSYELIAA